MVNSHESLQQLLSMINGDSIDINQELAVIVAKIESGNAFFVGVFSVIFYPTIFAFASGRYRSVNLFINDVKYIIEGKILKKVISTVSGEKALKEQASTLACNVCSFLKDILESKLEL